MTPCSAATGLHHCHQLHSRIVNSATAMRLWAHYHSYGHLMVHGPLALGFRLVLQSPVAIIEHPCLLRMQGQTDLLQELISPKSQQKNNPSNLES